MNNAPTEGIYVLSYTPGGYILVPTPQSGTSCNPKPHSEFQTNPTQVIDICHEIMQMYAKVITNTQTGYSQIGFVCFVSHIYSKCIRPP